MSIASHRSVSTEHSRASHRSAATRRVISSQRIASPKWIGLSSHIASDVCSIVFQRHDGMQSSYRPEHEAQSIALSTKIRKPLSEHGPDQPGPALPRQPIVFRYMYPILSPNREHRLAAHRIAAPQCIPAQHRIASQRRNVTIHRIAAPQRNVP